MKWRWYRSVIFWAGGFVMASIVWAWSDSVKHSRTFEWRTWVVDHWASGLGISTAPEPATRPSIQTGRLSDDLLPSLLSIDGIMNADRDKANEDPEPLKRMRWARPGFHRLPAVLDTESDSSPLPETARSEDLAFRLMFANRWADRMFYRSTLAEIPEGWVLFLPYWLLIAAFAVLWFPVLLWRSKRKRQG